MFCLWRAFVYVTVFLKHRSRRTLTFGYIHQELCSKRYYVFDLIAKSDGQLFESVSQPSHCLNQLVSKK